MSARASAGCHEQTLPIARCSRGQRCQDSCGRRSPNTQGWEFQSRPTQQPPITYKRCACTRMHIVAYRDLERVFPAALGRGVPKLDVAASEAHSADCGERRDNACCRGQPEHSERGRDAHLRCTHAFSAAETESSSGRIVPDAMSPSGRKGQVNRCVQKGQTRQPTRKRVDWSETFHDSCSWRLRTDEINFSISFRAETIVLTCLEIPRKRRKFAVWFKKYHACTRRRGEPGMPRTVPRCSSNRHHHRCTVIWTKFVSADSPGTQATRS